MAVKQTAVRGAVRKHAGRNTKIEGAPRAAEAGKLVGRPKEPLTSSLPSAGPSERARHLAAVAIPPVAELYELHAEICAKTPVRSRRGRKRYSA